MKTNTINQTHSNDNGGGPDQAKSEIPALSAFAADGVFESVCLTMRTRLGQLNKATVSEMLQIASLTVQAKKAYEDETGTGHGKRNGKGVPSFVQALAKRIGKSKSNVQRLITLAALSPETKARLERRDDLAMADLLKLAREKDGLRREKAIAALETDGPTAMNAVLRRVPTGTKSADQRAGNEALPQGRCMAKFELLVLPDGSSVGQAVFLGRKVEVRYTEQGSEIWDFGPAEAPKDGPEETSESGAALMQDDPAPVAEEDKEASTVETAEAANSRVAAEGQCDREHDRLVARALAHVTRHPGKSRTTIAHELGEEGGKVSDALFQLKGSGILIGDLAGPWSLAKAA